MVSQRDAPGGAQVDARKVLHGPSGLLEKSVDLAAGFLFRIRRHAAETSAREGAGR